MRQTHRDSTSLLRGSTPIKNLSAKPNDPDKQKTRPLFDKAIFLMIEREETLLGDILQHCGTLVQSAKQQVNEMKEHLEDQI